VSKHETKEKKSNVCGDRTLDACLTNKNFTFTLQQTHTHSTSLALKVNICVLSLTAPRCHVSKIQKCFTQNRSVDLYFDIGRFRLIVNKEIILKNLRREFPDTLYVCMSVRVGGRMRVRMRVGGRVCACARAHACMYIYIYIYIYE
jgi:hypothetical protein